MRDPLHWMAIRPKLALTFVAVCLIALGIGGSITSASASRALEDEIRRRMDLEARLLADSLDAGARLMLRRCEDFASDGYIRERAGGGAAQSASRDELQHHLVTNKLPLVAEFDNLAVLGPDGRLVASAVGVPARIDEVSAALASAGDAPWIGPLMARGDDEDPWTHVLSVPVRSLDGAETIGRLVAWVRTSAWVRGALSAGLGSGSATGSSVHLTLRDAAGAGLAVHALPPPTDAGPSGSWSIVLRPAGADLPTVPSGRGSYDIDAPLRVSGWKVSVNVVSPESLTAVGVLQARFLVVGLALAAAIGVLLLFPMRFLARPLAQLGDAARRVEAGDLSVRVEMDSQDEIGALARNFNTMTESVQQRTRGLEHMAGDLRRERDRLNVVIASLRDGLVVLDGNGRPVLSNAAAQPLLAILAARDPRLTVRENCVRGDPVGGCATCLVGEHVTARTCTLDAVGRVLEVHATPLPPGPDGRAGSVLLSRDVTERISQEARQIHQERLSVLGETAAVMAHELNNPLAAIRMFGQMAEQASDPGSQQRDHIEVVLRNTRTCERTIRELLDFAARTPSDPCEVDLRAVAEDAVRFVRPIAERAGVAISLRSGVAPALLGDEVQIRQVLVNLVMNAIQAMDGNRGSVEISLGAEASHAFADVIDDGPGVPSEVRDRVFEPFFTTKPRGEGTGLGLPTSRRIAELHGGGLDLVESRPGRTVFRMRLRATAPASVGGADAS